MDRSDGKSREQRTLVVLELAGAALVQPRASPSQGGGRWFESISAHQPTPIKSLQLAIARGAVSEAIAPMVHWW